jgi:hypothetical protein
MVATSGWKKALTGATLTIAPLPWVTIAACSSVARLISCAGPSEAARSIATGLTPLRPSRFSVVRAPSSARALVTASPMPLPAPVTTATCLRG